jgi:replicative DNA helicase
MSPSAKATSGGKLGRTPPHSLEAEQALLGAMLLHENAVGKAIEILRAGKKFYSAAHRKIFEAMSALFESRTPADLTTVAEELERRGDLEACGGRTYLAQLASGVATSANAEYYANIVLQKSVLREMIAASTDIIDDCFREAEEVDDILDAAEQKIFSISEDRLRTDFINLRDMLPKTFEAIEDYKDSKGGLAGDTTGFRDLDDMTAGLHGGEMIIVAARPSMGKSALVLNIAENFSMESGKAVAFFSLEMSKESLALRVLCGRARISSHRLRTGRLSDAEWSRLSHAAGPLSQTQIYIDDSPTMTVLEMRAKARRLASQVKLGLIIVDYMQMMSVSHRIENRQQEIAYISRGLKALAKELRIPVMACSQLSRQVEQRTADRRPQLSDLRESGAIEQDADVVLFIYREGYYKKQETPGQEVDDNSAEIIIAKQRNGPTGKIMLTFLKEYARFESLAAGFTAPVPTAGPDATF